MDAIYRRYCKCNSLKDDIPIWFRNHRSLLCKVQLEKSVVVDSSTKLGVNSVLVYLQGLTKIPAFIIDYIHYKVWNDVIYPLPTFNSGIVEV